MNWDMMAQSDNNQQVLLAEARGTIVHYLRDYVAMLADDAEWDRLFDETQDRLTAMARRVRQEIADGLAEPMDFDRL